MSEKLKTLKDLGIILTDVRRGADDLHKLRDCIQVNELKKLALIWIKTLTNLSGGQKAILAYDYHIARPEDVCAFIKLFFNLTKKDLK